MYTVYEIKKNQSLNDVANSLNVDIEYLKKLNNNINLLMEGQLIVVPNENNYFIYNVKKNDNLYEISKKYNIDVKTIELLNGLKSNEYIYPNQQLLIPKKNTYITSENDTIEDLLNIGITLEELKNNKINLQKDQIIFYKKD